MNLSTALQRVFMETVRASAIRPGHETDARAVLGEARSAVEGAVRHRIRLVDASGRGSRRPEVGVWPKTGRAGLRRWRRRRGGLAARNEGGSRIAPTDLVARLSCLPSSPQEWEPEGTRSRPWRRVSSLSARNPEERRELGGWLARFARSSVGLGGDVVGAMADQRLETARLVLEPLTGDHAALLYDGLRDDRLYRFIPRDPPVSLGALAGRYRRLEARRSPDGDEAWLNWAMRRREGQAYVGVLEATVLPDRSALIAYTVFWEDQRRGYAREGVARVVDALVRELRVETVAAEVDTRNVASIGLLERLGFARVGVRAGADFFKGASSDEYRYEFRAAVAR